MTIGIVLLFAATGYPQFCDPPGEYVGITQYPVQSSGSSTNRIAFDGLEAVHITWMRGPSSFERNVYYRFRHESEGWWAESVVGENDGAGYPTMALNSDYEAAVAYHNVSTDYVILAVDAVRGFGIFTYFDPPDVAPSGNRAFWPQVAISANDDIHIIMVEHSMEYGIYPSVIYSRSTDGGANWTSPDEAASVTLLNGCITAAPDGQVGIVYLHPTRSGEFSQVKNDIAYFLSADGREWDFSRPEFITDYENDNLDIYSPWGIDAVFDIDGNLNVVWLTGNIDSDGNFIDEITHLWHYSTQTGVTSQIAESSDPALTCTYDEAVTLPISLPSLTSIDYGFDNILGVIYVGFDESDASAEGECLGDLYGVFGFESGAYWVGPYNLTQTHTPDCLPGDCQSENFPSTAETMVYTEEIPLTYVMQNLGEITDTVYYMPVIHPIGDGIFDEDRLPGIFELFGNYPNPFNAGTTIGFELEESSHVKLTIYDITGARVATLADGEMEAGLYSINWDAGEVASGVYYYSLKANGEESTKKMTLLR
jgi:hypothetical protein